jgi:hypothetical protein
MGRKTEGGRTMNLEQLERQLRTKISVVEEEECRLRDWLESLHQVESLVVRKGFDSPVSDGSQFSSQLPNFVDRESFDENFDHLRSVRAENRNPEDLFEKCFNKLRENLSIQPETRSWKQRLHLEHAKVA